MERVNKLDLENVRIEFRNFSGEAGKFNRQGDRNFCVMLDDRVSLAEQLKEEGWNIKYLSPRNEDEDPVPYMPIKVSFGKYPPVIYLISGGRKTKLSEKDISLLDWAEIVNEHGERNRVDLQVSPYSWEISGREGISAYCKALYVRIAEDRFADKYMDIPDTAAASKFDEEKEND